MFYFLRVNVFITKSRAGRRKVEIKMWATSLGSQTLKEQAKFNHGNGYCNYQTYALTSTAT